MVLNDPLGFSKITRYFILGREAETGVNGSHMSQMGNLKVSLDF